MLPFSADRTVVKKISSLRRYTLFKVTLFGGTIEVLAKKLDFSIDGESKRDRSAR
jgi:hypothetical protein